MKKNCKSLVTCLSIDLQWGELTQSPSPIEGEGTYGIVLL